MSSRDDHASGRHFRLRLRAEPASVRFARQAVGALIADPAIEQERREAVVLAVSEAVSNAVVHAYADQPAAIIDLFAIRTGEQLIVTVTDDGCGLDQPSVAAGLGMGLHLIRSVADQALITAREHGGTTVQCRFRLLREGAVLGA